MDGMTIILTMAHMACPRHAEVATASAILDSLGWDAGTGRTWPTVRRRHSFHLVLSGGNWNHAAPLDLHISAEFNSSVMVHHGTPARF